MIERVLIPLVKSLITGFFVGAAVAVLLWGSLTMTTGAAVRSGFITWVLVSAAFWVFRLSEPGDQPPAEPPAEPFRAMVTVYREGQVIEGAFAEFPVSRETWVEFCEQLEPGFDTAETLYTGRGGVMTITEFRRVRNELIKRGFAYWNNPKHHPGGWSFNAVGRSFVRRSLPHQGDLSQTVK